MPTVSRNSLYLGLIVLVVAGVVAGVSYRALVQSAPMAQFGDVSLRIEIATSTEAQEKGLGGRRNLPDDYGMLFIFRNKEKYGFWMKDMQVPIDIFWLDDNGQVIAITPDVATSTYPNVFYPPQPVRYVLETAAGFAREHRIMIGTPLKLQNMPTVSM